MGMVYTDIGSLSLSPNFGMTTPASSSHEMENGRLTWGFPFMANYHASSDAVAEVKVSDCSDGFGENNETINHNANSSHEENPNENMISGRETDSGQSKLCARGHWRPAEDTKLKELVALYGPQNWNLIAEKLEGRSGKITKEKEIVNLCSNLATFICLHFVFSFALGILFSSFCLAHFDYCYVKVRAAG
jgi:myb proto-oncogene protein